MCGICGCGGGARTAGADESCDDAEARHAYAHAHGLAHDHADDHADDHGHGPTDGHAHAHAHPHGDHGVASDARATRRVQVERDILEKNDRLAGVNRRTFAAAEVLALNLVSSPGAGKTSLLVRSLNDLRAELPLAVIEGDQETSLDAERILATGVSATQINTGKMCHLDAGMVASALAHIRVPSRGVLFVENVGNLVCPAGFDLGEAAKVVLVSVTEGEDKPLKYPPIFKSAHLVLLTKVDVADVLGFKRDVAVENIRRIAPQARIIQLSARTGEGLAEWYAFLQARAGRR